MEEPGIADVLAQRPITLVLMMINSCSYCTNDLVFISFRYLIKILVGVQLQQKIRSQVLKLAPVDSRARASRSHQVLKRSLALWIITWTKSRRRRRFSRLESSFVSVKILVLDKV